MDIVYFLIDLLKDPLSTLQGFLIIHQLSIYAVLAAIVFAETGLIIMPFLPGDSLLFAVGLLCATTGKLDIGIVIFLLISAALLGDNLNYFIGKRFSHYIQARQRILFFKQEYIDKTEVYYQRHGAMTVILARFVPVVRTMAPFVAGAGNMKYTQYLTFCVLGASLWIISLTLAGYFLGRNEWVQHNFEKIVLAIVLVSFMPVVWQLVSAKLKKSDKS